MNKSVRRAAVSGTFYPSSPDGLRGIVDSYLNKAVIQSAESSGSEKKIVALIAPHAGYVYSGQVAAYSYKQIPGLNFNTAIIVGPSHYVAFKGASIYSEGYFQTPLGNVEVDSDLAAELMSKDSKIQFFSRAHLEEHSLEVQLPFLQRIISGSGSDVKILPILIHDFSESNCKMLADALASALEALEDKDALLIASTDLSHYPEYDEALKADSATIEAIKSFDTNLIRVRTNEYMRKNVYNLYCMMCGTGAVLSVMETAKNLGANRVEILKYANSGDVPIGSKERVVGYLSAGIYKRKT